MADSWSALAASTGDAAIAAFGQTLTYTVRSTSAAIAITAVFEPPIAAADSSPYAQVFLRLADLGAQPAAAPIRGDRIHVDGFGDYTVWEIKPDRWGFALLDCRGV